MFGYDPEAIYQDADIEMMELAEAADRAYEDEPCGQPRPSGPPGHFCMNCGWRTEDCREAERRWAGGTQADLRDDPGTMHV